MKRSKRDVAELRRRAEERLDAPAPDEIRDAELLRTVHELEVHQVELELQTEELRSARLEVDVLLRRYTELFDFAPIGYFGLGADGTIREVNFAGARLLGQERGRLVGRRLGAFVSPRDAATFDRFLATVLVPPEEAPTTEVCELTLAREGAPPLTVRLTAACLEGPTASALFAVEDITARKHAEDALREESHRKDEFLAALSHELRNPLAPIRNGLLMLGPEGGGERSQKALAIIDRQVRHLTRIVDDLLDVTRIARGKIRLHPEPLELVELVRRTIEDHRATFEAAGIRLEGRIEAEACWVRADATRIAQILGNLLGNAAKFTSGGGRAEVIVRREAPGVSLVVRDDGVGIASDVRERLFQPFSQGAQSLERTRGGLGLGLATVKGLVELHGGTVTVSSDGPGRGAEFTVRLPVVDAPAAAAHSAAPRNHPQRRVLVIATTTRTEPTA